MPFSQYLRTFLGPDRPRSGIFFLLISLIVLVGGITHAVVLRWLSDDIFITFRYIDQWFDGNGLVYNPGEHVEGYTHPLWLLLLSGWRLLGFDMVEGSMLFGIVAQGLLLTTLVYASWRMAGRASMAFPAAAGAVALHQDASVWATSGLETALYTFLVTLAVVLVTIPKIEERSRMLLTGTVLVLATFTRPDGVVFLVMMGSVIAAREWVQGSGWKMVRKRCLQFAIPAAVFIPYAGWKLIYYGDLLPNTYYAKSGGGFHFKQGLTYIGLYLQAYPSTILLIITLVAFWVAFRRSGDLRSRVFRIFSNERLSLSVVAILFSAVYALGFVARVGGDFMFARFLIPIVPLLYLSIEAAIRYLGGTRRLVVLASLVVLPLSVATADAWSRKSLFASSDGGRIVVGGNDTGILDEHQYWTKPITDGKHNAIDILRGVGRKLHTYFDGLTVRILIRGQASLGYESRATEVLENWGLTDPYIAHLEITGRGRVGHEKAAPGEYILARRVHFFFFKDMTPSDTSFYRIVRFDLPYGWSQAEMHFYDRDLMKELQQRFPDAITFVDFERYLDEYLDSSEDRSRAEVEKDLDSFRAYYFRHNYDPEREKRFIDVLKKKRDEEMR